MTSPLFQSRFGGSTMADKVEVSNCPTDTISCLSWSPTGPFLAATSWDGEIRAYEANATPLKADLKLSTKKQNPVLNATWTQDGSKVVTTSADGEVALWDLQTNQSTKIGSHTSMANRVRRVAAFNLYVTCGNDGALLYWDLRSPNPALTVNVQRKVYAIDVVDKVLVAGCDGLQFKLFDLNNPNNPLKEKPAALKYSIRDVAISPDVSLFVEGGVEGKSALQYFNDEKGFAFKCHRSTYDCFQTNVVCFHPTTNATQVSTFATGGSDGHFTYWHGKNKRRVKDIAPSNTYNAAPVTAAGFSSDGKIVAIAYGNDWSKGSSGMANIKTSLHLRGAEIDKLK
ncbi:hypothetical protein P9112_004819 [Eukaryota sp. TZLM1-RC]